MDCYCCIREVPKTGTKVCPECGHNFKGKGWEGLDAHWKAKHQHIVPYHELWKNLCPEHKHSSSPGTPNSEEKPFQRLGSVSNSQVGRDFESAIKDFFSSQGLILKSDFKVPVGVGSNKKLHAFDLGCESQKIIIECKSHRWTQGRNVPSAKLAVWNEAMYYFLAAPPDYRKIMFVLRDFSSRKKETLVGYYLRTYAHLIPDGVEFWEYDELTKKAERVI